MVRTRTAANKAATERLTRDSIASLLEDVPLYTLIKTLIKTLSANNATNPGKEPVGPRD